MTVCEVLEELIGDDLTRHLCDLYGGRTVYVPIEPLEGHWLVRAVGWDAAEKLCGHYRANTTGARLTLPKGEQHRMRALLPEVAKMMDEGVSLGDTAIALNIHQRTVSRHRERIYRARAGRLGDRINRLRKDGYSISWIAAELEMQLFCLEAIVAILDAREKRETERQRANRGSL